MTSSTRDILNNPIGPRDVVQHILLHHFDYFAKYISDSITESTLVGLFSLTYKRYLQIGETSSLWHHHRAAFPLYWTALVLVA